MQPGACPVPCSWLLGPPWLCDKGTVSRRPQDSTSQSLGQEAGCPETESSTLGVLDAIK